MTRKILGIQFNYSQVNTPTFDTINVGHDGVIEVQEHYTPQKGMHYSVIYNDRIDEIKNVHRVLYEKLNKKSPD